MIATFRTGLEAYGKQRRGVIMGTIAQRAKGMAEQAAGRILQGVGKVFGSEKLQAEGKAEELKGETREEAAKARARTKATAEEAAGAVKKGVGTVLGNARMEAEGAALKEKGEGQHKSNE
jgi:uncharacterized protein YjbJ (UPF0337 family)